MMPVEENRPTVLIKPIYKYSSYTSMEERAGGTVWVLKLC